MNENPRLKSIFQGNGIFGAVVAILYLVAILLEFTATHVPWFTDSFAPIYLLMAVQLLPVLLIIKTSRANYLAIVLISHFLTYSVAKINILNVVLRQESLSAESIFAIQQQMICTVIMTLSYYAFRKLVKFKNSFGNLTIPIFTEKTCYRALIVFSVYELIPKPGLLGSPLVSYAMMYIVAGVTISAFNLNRAFFFRIVIIQMVLATLSYLKTGSLGAFVMMFPFIALTMLLNRQYLMAVTVAIPIILSVAVIQTNKNAYRNFIYNDMDASLAERFTFFYMTLSNTLQGKKDVVDRPGSDNSPDDEVAVSDAIAAGLTRVGDDSLERVLTMTPSVVPFWMGRSYEFLFYFLVPRFIFSDKPTREIWHDFGMLYQYLNDDDDATSISLTYFAEGYMNFGFIGLYIVAIVVGLLLATAESFALYVGRGQIAPEYLLMIKPFEFLESDFVSVVTSVVIVLVAIFVTKTVLTSLNRSIGIFADNRQYA